MAQPEAGMAISPVAFAVTRLVAEAREGVPVRWRGRDLTSGPLSVELDDARPSAGALDYERRRAEVELHVRLWFPELAGLLADLDVDPAFTEPVRAVVRSAGAILDDGGFRLSGDVELAPHALVSAEDHASARILPGR
jgi:hypothetical protein